MTRPINMYNISRIEDEHLFNLIESHQSHRKKEKRFHDYEIKSLKIITEYLIEAGTMVKELDDYFFGFVIPQIEKEFDLLKITDALCLNIELKSTTVPEEQILDQLLRNRYYLRHLEKDLTQYSIITDEMKCYRLTNEGELESVSFSVIVESVKEHANNSLNQIDDLFKVSNFLVSPLNTPKKFILGEYFLTQSQEQIKKDIFKALDNQSSAKFFHITGNPGTGKTLLLYDIAKSLSINGNTIIIHCGKLAEGQRKIIKEINNLSIIPASDMRKYNFSLSSYSFVLVDEVHRIYPYQFELICKSVIENGKVCIFSSDPGQVLSNEEKQNNIVDKINALDLKGKFTLSDKIRTNPELRSFIIQLRDLKHRPKKPMSYSNVDLNYANTTAEAQMLIDYYRSKGYVFINYSKSNRNPSPYMLYKEDFDTHHVIGQEFDKVLMLMDNSFYYDNNGVLCGKEHPNPNYLYPNLLYQGITRVREKIALIVVNAPDLMDKIASIIEENEIIE